MKVRTNSWPDRSGATTRRVATLLIVIALMKTSALLGQNAAPASGPRTTSGSDVSALPNAPEKALVLKHCMVCHDLAWVARSGGSEQGWTERLNRMIRAGATIPRDQIPAVAAYLAQTLPERPRSAASSAADRPPAAAKPVDQASGQVLTITVSTLPDPPRSGGNTIEAIVTRQDGRPVTDATVSALLQMPPMPSMNMPEMSTTLSLLNQGGGLYRGKGQLVMSGTWNVTVTASLGGMEVGRQRLTIIAK